LLKQKVAIILGYFILSKNRNEPPKVAQFGEKLPNLVTLYLSAFLSAFDETNLARKLKINANRRVRKILD
jgi:hypothetical protein